MDKIFREKDFHPTASEAQSAGKGQGPELCPITHKEFNEFMKEKGEKGEIITN